MANLYVVCVILQKQEENQMITSHTLSWRLCEEANEALGAAVEYALKVKPGFHIIDVSVMAIDEEDGDVQKS